MTDAPEPPAAIELSDVLEVIKTYLDERQTGSLVINQRLDWLVGKIGGYEELTHRFDLLSTELEKQVIFSQSLFKVVQQAQSEFDARTELVLHDAELLRRTLAEATVAFQQAQEHQDDDWDDKWKGLSERITGLSQRIELEVSRWTQAISERHSEQAEITVARISTRGQMTIAIVTVIGGGLMALLTTLVLHLLGK
jgi:hypothetical protein